MLTFRCYYLFSFPWWQSAPARALSHKTLHGYLKKKKVLPRQCTAEAIPCLKKKAGTTSQHIGLHSGTEGSWFSESNGEQDKGRNQAWEEEAYLVRVICKGRRGKAEGLPNRDHVHIFPSQTMQKRSWSISWQLLMAPGDWKKDSFLEGRQNAHSISLELSEHRL